MVEEENKPSLVENGVNKYVASVILLSVCNGTTLVILPRAASEIGWLTIPLLLIFGLLAVYGGYCLAECWFILEKRWPEYKGPTRKPYLEIGYRAFGNKGKYAVVSVYTFTMIGLSILAIIMISQFATTIFTFMKFCHIVVALGLIAIPLTWLEAPKNFWQVNATALTGTTIGSLIIMLDLYINREAYPPPTSDDFEAIGVVFGISRILYTVGFGSSCPMVQNEMKEKSQFYTCLIFTYTGIMVVGIPLIAISYVVLGDSIPVNMLLYKMDQNSVISKAINVFLMIDWFSSFLTYFSPLCMQFEESLNIPRKFSWKRAVFRTFVVMLMVTVVLLFPSLSHIVSILGGFTVSFLTFICPSVFYWKLQSDLNKNIQESSRTLSSVNRILLLILLILGVVCSIVITSTTLRNIMKFTLSDSCLFSLINLNKSTSILNGGHFVEYVVNGTLTNISNVILENIQ